LKGHACGARPEGLDAWATEQAALPAGGGSTHIAADAEMAAQMTELENVMAQLMTFMAEVRDGRSPILSIRA